MDPLMCTDESIEDLVTSKHNNKAKDQTCKSYRSALPPIQEDLGE